MKRTEWIPAMTPRLPALSLAIIILGLAARASAEDQIGAVPAPVPTPVPGDAAPGPEMGKAKEKTPGMTADKTEKPKPGKLQEATFGGGCFWCTEAVFQRVPGVRMVVSGYAGGTVPFPTYEMVSSGMTGHAEVIHVVFDPAIVSYEMLLEVFWRSHNPTTPNAQGPDSGTQYRSIILYHDEDQKKAAEKVHRALKARRVLKGTVVTQLVPFQGFYPAEAYHQNYYNNHPLDPYSMVYIAPKFDVFRKIRKELQMHKAAAKP
jgi:peptide-methionine (S)-S-oxide reductase